MRPFFKRTLSALTSCLLGVGVILSALQNVPFEVIAANDCIIDSSTTYQTIRSVRGATRTARH